MSENKLVKMVILFLSDGEKPRHKVSAKIKNYSKAMQSEAIKSLINGKYIVIREDRASKTGRTPAFISLTEKGEEKAAGYSDKPEHKSIWNL
tara:strand:+ start:165 stop:440 length:276 start_codon:yes stop_codon:yes gene_type:complete